MAVGKEFTIQGLDELDAVLRDLPIVMQKRVENPAVRAAAMIVKKEAEENAPVDTGQLKDNLMVKKVSGVDGQYLLGVRRPVSRRFHLTEFGTVYATAQPFVRPAIDTVGQQAISVMVQKLHAGLMRETKKLAGKYKKSGLGR